MARLVAAHHPRHARFWLPGSPVRTAARADSVTPDGMRSPHLFPGAPVGARSAASLSAPPLAATSQCGARAGLVVVAPLPPGPRSLLSHKTAAGYAIMPLQGSSLEVPWNSPGNLAPFFV